MAMTVGCNQLSSQPRIDSSKIAFGPIAATRRACPPPLADLERKFLNALAAARSFKVDGKAGTMTFFDDAGSIVAIFFRVDET